MDERPIMPKDEGRFPLREILELAGKTQWDLAKLMHVDRSAVQKWHAGLIDPNWSSIRDILDALNMDAFVVPKAQSKRLRATLRMNEKLHRRAATLRADR